jgi:hypothetical protein
VVLYLEPTYFAAHDAFDEEMHLPAELRQVLGSFVDVFP